MCAIVVDSQCLEYLECITLYAGLKNRDIKINGNTLKLHPNGTVPNLLAYSKCGEYNSNETLEVEPYSLFFWVFKDVTNLKMCE